MNLLVVCGFEQRNITAEPGVPLSASLGRNGWRLDLRCGGNGRCNRCLVELLSGKFLSGGKLLDCGENGLHTVRACDTSPAGETGSLRIPPASLQQELVAVETGFLLPLETAAPGGGWSVAVDIGTTTVAALLLRDGVAVAAAGRLNRQAVFGDNVIDRIAAAASPEGLAALQRAVAAETIDPLLRELTPEPEKIRRIAVAGNTVMTHLLYGIDPAPIGVAPFEPPLRRFPKVPAKELGISAAPEAELLAAPAVGGNVGGDLVAGMAATRFGGSGRTELLLDLGTNCEMILSHNGKFLAASAAAGPAFERSGAASGSRAGEGVIEHLRFDAAGRFELSVRGGGKAAGLCGSALVDFLASGRRCGLLDEFGRFDPGVPARWGRRVMRDGVLGCRIAPGVVILETDVEALLQAKAAVWAGIHSLLRATGIEPGALERLWLCGGFARGLDLASAQAIGMLPALPGAEFCICGNAALAGAALLAAHPERMNEFDRLASLPQELPLNSIPGFAEAFIDGLLLSGK
ncbi:ASKHA domain-containing protein [Victivallis sp.]|uniref:ASKHA domain-containing protein n=1 Tax=Victivallis sp. TaxID=2049020 RepID=UPI003A920BE8